MHDNLNGILQRIEIEIHTNISISGYSFLKEFSDFENFNNAYEKFEGFLENVIVKVGNNFCKKEIFFKFI